MIKIFRNTRKKFLREGKTANYLKYAIGEIILVVIGILIALQINNWNQHRKEKQNLNTIYQLIVEDLESDNLEIDSIITNLNRKKEILNKVLSKTLTKDYLLKSPLAVKMITGYPDFSIQTRGYDLLKESSTTQNQMVDSLNFKISNLYKTYILEIDIDQQFLSNDLKENYSFWKSKCSWWADYIGETVNDDFIEYAVNSQDFRNRVATYNMVVFDLYIPKLVAFKKKSQEIIHILKPRMHDKTLQ